MERPLRVLTATSSFPRYTGDYYGNYVYNLCCRLLQNGVDLTVLAPRSRSTTDKIGEVKLKRFRFMPSQKLETLPEQTLKYASLEDSLQLPFYLGSALFNIAKEEADIVHAHFAIPMGFLSALNPRSVPLLITCHGSDCTLPVDKPLYRPFVKIALGKADRVVAVSKFVKRMALKLGAKEDRTEVIYLGTDMERFKPAQNRMELRRELGVPEDRIVIGALGRLVPEKRVEDLIKAASVVNEKIDAHFVIGGEGFHRKYLEGLSKRLRIDNVQFLGEIRDAARFHQLCDIYVLASEREGLSVSLQEAMATGVVPVAVNSHGCPELIDNGENGFLFRPMDVEDLTRKILEASDNLRLGAKAREKVVEHFNMDRSTSRYIEVFKELVSLRRRD